jgi:hypothetical protein
MWVSCQCKKISDWWQSVLKTTLTIIFFKVYSDIKKRSKLDSINIKLNIVEETHFNLNFELQRRTVQRAVYDEWHEFNQFNSMFEMRSQYISIMANLNQVLNSNYGSTERSETSQELTQQIHDKLYQSQNPSNCKASKILWCVPAMHPRYPGKARCGWGCIINFATKCMRYFIKIMSLLLRITRGLLRYAQRFDEEKLKKKI